MSSSGIFQHFDISCRSRFLHSDKGERSSLSMARLRVTASSSRVWQSDKGARSSFERSSVWAIISPLISARLA